MRKTLAEPTRPRNVSAGAQWLSGEGAGSWFDVLDEGNQVVQIQRLDPDGKLECSSLFMEENRFPFFIDRPFRVIHLSHCNQVSILQEDSLLIFKAIKINQ